MKLVEVDPNQIPAGRGRSLKDQPAVRSFMESDLLSVRIELEEGDKPAESVASSFRNFASAKELDVSVRTITENGNKVIYLVKEDGAGQKYADAKVAARQAKAQRDQEAAEAAARGEELPKPKRGRKPKVQAPVDDVA